MSGLSNACYRVKIEADGDEQLIKIEPSALLYRCFDNQIVDWNVENALFTVFSE
jgi:hypothetical protein